MSKKSATDTIKQLNPKNLSAVVPQSLDLLQTLKKVSPTDNPKMPQAVGQGNLMEMLSFIQQLFSNKGGGQSNNQQSNCQIYLDEYNQTGNTDYMDQYTQCLAMNNTANTTGN
jgi:hypothetical protein